MKKIVLFSVLLFMAALDSPGQDFHFSQYDRAPVLLNPALTGNFAGKYRIGLNYRDQWSAFNAPYRTLAANFDGKINNRRILEKGCTTITDYFGLGAYVFSDRAGDGNLTNTNAMLLFSYNKVLSRTLTGGLGFAAGVGNKRIDLDKLKFISQWNGANFDDNNIVALDGKENSFNYLDFNAGFYLSDSISKSVVVTLGSSLNHINRPTNRFFSNDIPIPRKINAHAAVNWGTGKWTYQTSGLYSLQGDFDEILFGFNTIYHSPGRDIDLDESKIDKFNKGLKTKEFNLTGGVGIRILPVRDIIPAIGADIKQFTVMLSYDISLADKYSRNAYQGGFEISGTYRFNRFYKFYK